MRAVVLVGGQGTRLRPLTYHVPKPMLPVAGRPMIARTVEWLARHGVEEVVFSLGYRPDAFLEAFPDAKWAGVSLVYAVEDTPLDTAGAIRFAAASVGALEERLVVVNGDVLTDLDLGALVAFHEEHRGEGTIHLTPVADPSAFGVVPTDADGRVLAFIEKPPPGTAPTNLINAGTYVLEPDALARIEPGRRVSIEREIFPEMVTDKVLFARGDEAYWIDTGTPQTYLAAQFDVLAGRRAVVELPVVEETTPLVFLAPGAHAEGSLVAPVLLGEGARVDAGARVERAVLGRDVVVEAEATVRDSVVLDGAHIGSGATVVDSVVGPDATIGPGAAVLDVTIVGCGATVGARTRLSGARFPE